MTDQPRFYQAVYTAVLDAMREHRREHRTVEQDLTKELESALRSFQAILSARSRGFDSLAYAEGTAKRAVADIEAALEKAGWEG